MPFPYDVDDLAAIERLEDANSNTYNASTNPEGYPGGGHIVNFTDDLNATARVANAIAAAAEASEDAADNMSGTSASSLAIGTGSKSFTTQADKFFDVGRWVDIVSGTGGGANYMIGQVTAYSGTSLTVNVTKTGGTGTFANWTIYTSNQPGSDGSTGSTGATGATGRMSGLPYIYESSSFTAADPGTGKFKTNNASFAATTALYISETDDDGNAVTNLVRFASLSTSATRGQLTFFKLGAVNNWVSFDVTGSFTDNGGWDTIVVTYRDGQGAISDEDDVLLHVDRVGDKGDTGETGAAGVTGETGAVGPTTTHEFTWDTGTTDADPGNGKVRVNHATYSSVTEMYVDNLEIAGGTISAWVDSWDDSSHTARRGDIIIRQVDDTDNWLHLFVDGVVTDATGYRRVPVDYVAHNNTLTGEVSLLFVRTGDDGDDGEGAGNVNTSGAVTGGDLVIYADGTGNVISSGGAKTAASIPNVPAGTIAATNVQSALNELDTDKAPTANPSLTGTVEIAQAVTFPGDISPSQITGDQNNYAPTGFSTATVLRLNSDAARSITGLAGGADGRRVLLINVGSFAITLNDESGSSTAANRFALSADAVIGVDQAVWLYYDSTTARWRAEKSSVSASEVAFTPTGDIAAATVALALAELDTEKLSKAGGTMTGSLALAARADVASGTTTNIGAATTNYVNITGTTTITAFDTVAAGIWREIRFNAALTLTHNATTLILPGGANITTAAGDTALAISEGSGNWRVMYFVKASGRTLLAASETQSGDIELATVAEAGTGTDTARAVTPAGLNTAFADLASGTTTDLGAQTTQKIRITGTTTITGFGTVAAGIIKYLRFAAALTLTHNGTSLILPTAANITTAADDQAIAVSLGSGNWVVLNYERASGLPLALATTAQYLANTSARALSTDQVNASGAFVAINDSVGAIAWDMAGGFNASITLDGNHVFSNPTNPIVGRSGMIKITQDATGTRVPTWGTNWEAAGGTFPVLSTAAGSVDYVFYIVSSATSIVVTGIIKAVV